MQTFSFQIREISKDENWADVEKFFGEFNNLTEADNFGSSVVAGLIGIQVRIDKPNDKTFHARILNTPKP